MSPTLTDPPPPLPRLEADEDRYLRLGELARYSSLSQATLRRLMADPDHPLPAFRVGRLILVSRKAFDSWLADHQARLTAAAPALAHVPADIRRAALAIRGYVVDDDDAEDR